MIRILIISFIILSGISCSRDVHLFTSFREPADKGLQMLYSYDGLQWERIDTVLLKPGVGMQRVMRDPSMVQGPDGIFHLVWTSSWRGDKGFGYASSPDLLHWSEQRSIPVMEHEPATVNVWAPEIFHDRDLDRFVIIWASTIPGRFDRGIEEDSNNHRMYFTTTRDFKTFSETRVFLEPGFSVIDAVIVRKPSGDHVLVLKDNTRPERNLKVAEGHSADGPWTNISKPFTGKFTEGPTVLKLKSGWIIYFDAYQDKRYGAVMTSDFKHFKDVSNRVVVPKGHKHGTILTVKRKYLKTLLEATNGHK